MCAELSCFVYSGVILSSLQEAQHSLFAIYIKSGQSLPVHCLSNISLEWSKKDYKTNKLIICTM